MAVNIRFYPGRLKPRSRTSASSKQEINSRAMLDEMVKQGFRAQLRSGSLLTGQLYVALDFFPDVPPATIKWHGTRPELPTTSGMMEQFQSALLRIIQKLEKLPLNELAGDARKTVQTLDQTLKSADKLLNDLDSNVVPEAKQMLQQTRKTMDNASQTLVEVKKTMSTDGQLQTDLRDTLRELGKAAQALRALSDYLERNPEALIRGKKEE
jgi:paraquat-inducible protein B